uniref:Uncharacterized protein n=1 Tax=Megaselia scalaris TaxID=36166 RepID=T1GS32_MEGSC
MTLKRFSCLIILLITEFSGAEIINFFNNKIYNTDEFCSLRRSRSLAIIREENNNLLSGKEKNHKDLPQLIPRAKLLNKAIIQERFGKNDSNRKQSLINQNDNEKVLMKKSFEVHKEDKNNDDKNNSSHQKKTKVISKTRLYQNQKARKGKPNQFQKNLQRYQDNSQSSAFPESTTSITDSSCSSSNQSDSECKNYLINIENNIEIKSEDIEKSEKSGVIVYDTVYLSSEESSEDQSFLAKPIIISAVEKKLKTFSDYANVNHKNILGNISYINNIETIDNQYYSLPDCDISQSLNISEKIDDNLRSSYNINFSIDQIEEEESTVTTPKNPEKESKLQIIVTNEDNEIIQKENTTVSHLNTNIQKNNPTKSEKEDTKHNSLRKQSSISRAKNSQKSIVRTQSFKTMSRPQILQIIDTKRKLKPIVNNDEGFKTEFLEKVNSVKNFWSKLNNDTQSQMKKT